MLVLKLIGVLSVIQEQTRLIIVVFAILGIEGQGWPSMTGVARRRMLQLGIVRHRVKINASTVPTLENVRIILKKIAPHNYNFILITIKIL